MNIFAWIGFLIMAFLGVTFCNRVLGGQMFTVEDTAFLHDLRLTQPYDIGPLTFTGPNLSWITSISSMLNWQDYIIWGGLGAYVQLFLYAISFMILVAIAVTFLSIAINAFRLR